jgi:hypothetical protein
MRRTKMDGNGLVEDDDSFVREGGVFAPRNGGRDVGCDEEQDYCPPDEVLEDPVNDEHVPGTVDDLPYDYGTEDPSPTDQMLGLIETGPVIGMQGVGDTGYDEDVTQPSPLGAKDERLEWERLKPLIDEDEAEPYNLPEMDEAEVADLERALGEDAAGPLVESEEGTSATGSAGSAEHGGFSDRDTQD